MQESWVRESTRGLVSSPRQLVAGAAAPKTNWCPAAHRCWRLYCTVFSQPVCDSPLSFVWLYWLFYPIISTRKFSSLHTMTILATSQNIPWSTFHLPSFILRSPPPTLFRPTLLYQAVHASTSPGHRETLHILQELKRQFSGFEKHI